MLNNSNVAAIDLFKYLLFSRLPFCVPSGYLKITKEQNLSALASPAFCGNVSLLVRLVDCKYIVNVLTIAH